MFDETDRRKEINKTFPTKKEEQNWAEKEARLYRDAPNRKPPSDETLGEIRPVGCPSKRSCLSNEKLLIAIGRWRRIR